MTLKLVILLHGVGSQGAHLAPLGQVWQAAMPGTDFVAADGPQAFDHGGAGRQWFSVRGGDGRKPARARGAGAR